MNCLVNEKGELLEILQKEREAQTGEHIVPLEGYYEVFNTQLYSQALWDFKLKKWVGVGEPNYIKVYVKLDTNKVIKEINSSIFLQEVVEWVEIDKGVGDRYSHAQSQYLPKGLIDEKGRYNYTWNNSLIELTEEEKNILFPPLVPKPSKEDLFLEYQADLEFRLSSMEVSQKI